eukprot:jgi/Mesvir1/24279/Mv10977-RA.1
MATGKGFNAYEFSRPMGDEITGHEPDLPASPPRSPMLKNVQEAFKDDASEGKTPLSAAGGGLDAFSANAEFDVIHLPFWKSSEFWLKAGSVLSVVVVTIIAFIIPIVLVIYNTAGPIKGPKRPIT